MAPPEAPVLWERLRWQFEGRGGEGVDVGLVFKGMHLCRRPCFDVVRHREGVIANGFCGIGIVRG